jgi:probable HAF family extracellular repeat protein
MNQIKRIIHSTMGKALAVCAFALSILVTASVAVASRGYGSAGYSQGQLTIVNFTQIDYHEADLKVDLTSALAINSFGQVVGIYIADLNAENAPSRGFLYNSRGFIKIDYPDAITTSAQGINDLGQVVGTFRFLRKSEIRHGYRYDISSQRYSMPFDCPSPAVDTGIHKINNLGQFVGGISLDLEDTHGYVSDNGGGCTQINVQGSPNTNAYGINKFGHIVGIYGEAIGQERSFLRINETTDPTLIDVRNAITTTAQGINDLGEIVGYFKDSIGVHGFLYYNGDYTTIDIEGAINTQIFDINVRGEIVGSFQDWSGIHGFKAAIR